MKEIIICETAVSVWDYHLRLVELGQEKYGGIHEGYALCGKKIGWDTKIPLSCYNVIDNRIPEHWCKKCLKIAQDTHLPGVENICGKDVYEN